MYSWSELKHLHRCRQILLRIRRAACDGAALISHLRWITVYIPRFHLRWKVSSLNFCQKHQLTVTRLFGLLDSIQNICAVFGIWTSNLQSNLQNIFPTSSPRYGDFNFRQFLHLQEVLRLEGKGASFYVIVFMFFYFYYQQLFTKFLFN